MRIDCDFPGGNIIVDRVEGDNVYLQQDLRDTEGWWFYWCFRVQNAAGRKIFFNFTNGSVVGVRGPAVSTDKGLSWSWAADGCADNTSFAYTFPENAAETRFCFSIPYLESNLNKFLAGHTGDSHLSADTLCLSGKGRQVEMLRLGMIDGSAPCRVLLTCRHHCCEMTADYALEGLMEHILNDNESGLWLRRNVEFLAVPFMDKDGVEDGDQGKNRRPHDHNRDYDALIHPEVRALSELVPSWSEGCCRVALDLHCPHIRGKLNEIIYFPAPSQKSWEEISRFSSCLERLQEGPLPFRAADNLPFGQDWNTASNFGQGASFAMWAEKLPGIRMAAALEIPYANAAGRDVTAASARALGHDLGRALASYLKS